MKSNAAFLSKLTHVRCRRVRYRENHGDDYQSVIETERLGADPAIYPQAADQQRHSCKAK